MNRWMKNVAAVGFLVIFLPYTVTLLLNGRQGIHREEELPELEYQVLSCMMQEDYSWMEEGTLTLMAILYRTECVRTGKTAYADLSSEVYDKSYGRMYDAVVQTKGQVITVGGEYKELPYHAVSSGRTRAGALLGEEYTYVLSADCPYDRESENYLHTYLIPEENLGEILGADFDPENAVLERDDADYVSYITAADQTWQGEAFRSLLHLPSSCFQMSTDRTQNAVRITVKGSGHGFGLSLYTADRMVRDGADLTEIIQKFYQEAICITIP